MTEKVDVLKYVEKAYKYYPYGFDGIQKFDEWMAGPTFVVKLPDGQGKEAAVLGAFGIYKKDPYWESKLDSLVKSQAEATEVVTIDAAKHNKCTGRQIMADPKDEFPMEMAYPLYMLSKKMGVDHFKRAGIVLYGYDEADNFVGMFAARYQAISCQK